MRPKIPEGQMEIGKPKLESFLNKRDGLVILARVINWERFNRKFSNGFDASKGRPGLSIRLMVGLTYLKYLYNLSDRKLIQIFLQNPLWQYFCGFEYMQDKVPCDSSSLTCFRRERLKEEGCQELLRETVELGQRCGFIKPSRLSEVIVDTTVQEKDISFPTDSKLMNKVREGLVNVCKERGIRLRQSYKFKGKREAIRSSRYFHAKQYKRGRASLRKQRNYLGCVIRDIERKVCEDERDDKLKEMLLLGRRIYEQKRGGQG